MLTADEVNDDLLKSRMSIFCRSRLLFVPEVKIQISFFGICLMQNCFSATNYGRISPEVICLTP